VVQLRLRGPASLIPRRALEQEREQFLASVDARNSLVCKIRVELGDVLP